MRRELRKWISKVLIFVMVLTMSMPLSVNAQILDETSIIDTDETISGDEIDAEQGELQNESEFNVDDEAIDEEVSSVVETEETSDEFTIENVATHKLIKTYSTNDIPLTVDGEEGEEGTVFSKCLFMNYANNDISETYQVASFISRDYNKGIKSSTWAGEAYDAVVKMHDAGIGGWESIVIVPNGDGTVSFKDSRFKKYITVNNSNQLEGRLIDDVEKENLTDKEKFIIHSKTTPNAITDLAVDQASRTKTTLDLSWTNPASIYTNIQLFQKGSDDAVYEKVADLADSNSYQVTDLAAGGAYSFKLLVINENGNPGDTTYSSDSNEITAQTRAGQKPATPTNVKLEQAGEEFVISWDEAEASTHYTVQCATSMFGEYEDVITVLADQTSVNVTPTNEDKYENYYRVVALNNGAGGDDTSGAEISEQSDYTSLETEMFGRHTIIFAETDKAEKIDETLQALFDKQNDFDADAQFKGEQYQVYFKPGDYTQTACMYLGFYTSFNGLGKTPYDVKLNNIAIPAYLPAGELGGDGYNATCNFWRSTENLSVINTGNEQGKAGYGSWRGDELNWAVAQAAPLRRVYSTRKISYDWNYGWASGGYVADCFIDAEGEAVAGTWSGQQFYTRNSKMAGGVFGTTLNNFFQGVEAPNLVNGETGEALRSEKGYSNWGIPGEANDKGEEGQQVVTNIETTDKISEKPFLYLDDDGEYKVFVPAVVTDTAGISWSEDDMGAGNSIALDEFYIAKPEDNAAVINDKLAKGKNIYFTPGTYYAETPILINNPNTILLGSGMTSIIPNNSEAAIKVKDEDGIRIAGITFDAGVSSEYLLQVGTKGEHNDHSANPIILQDLFFRVGGTTDVLTKAENALEINSDDVIGDHFWIWRADHGAGVEWYGNESQHGLIVNGDDVTCYALFNEHFQNYNTLWNGDNGTTYFYQNETCYDPISQDSWMSHNGTVNGYASYKVSNNVESHYAVGLGIYNVFIYTGPTYDSTEVKIQLDNAIEVPNKPDILVENACVQTFANDECVLQKINHIINGVGYGVSSGLEDEETGEKGEGWSRKFLLYYNNGNAKYGKQPGEDQKGQFIGTEEKSNIEQPKKEIFDLTEAELAQLNEKKEELANNLKTLEGLNQSD